MKRYATRTPGEREDGEAERLIRPSPKQKPPRRDRRRERMDADKDSDPDLQGKDTSLNYKSIGGSMLDRLALRFIVHQAASSSGKGKKIPARSRETGKKVYISPETFKDEPGKYRKYAPMPGDPKPKRGDPDFEDKPKGQAPKPAPGAAKGPDTSEGDEEEEKEEEDPESSDDSTGADADDAKGGTEGEEADEQEEKDEDESSPEPAVATKLGIQPPKQRETTAGERREANLLLVDHLPPKLAAKLIANGIHPDDVKELIGSYRAAKSRPLGNPAEFASKAGKIYETDPDRIEPPKTWRPEDGDKVAFEELTPDLKATAYRKHQMQVVAMSLAAQHQLEEKLSFEGTVPKDLASRVTQALLKNAAGKAKQEAAAAAEAAAEAPGAEKATPPAGGKAQPPAAPTAPPPAGGKTSPPASGTAPPAGGNAIPVAPGTTPGKTTSPAPAPPATAPAGGKPVPPRPSPKTDEKGKATPPAPPAPPPLTAEQTKAKQATERKAAIAKAAEEVFDWTAKSEGVVKIPEGLAKKILASVAGDEEASSLMQSFLEGNDYKKAKDLYLGQDGFSERDKPAHILEGLRSARDFFKVQARTYGVGEGHEGAKRFEAKTLAQLRELDPDKYKVVRRSLDEEDGKRFREAKRKHAIALASFKQAHEAWQKKPFESKEPTAPEAPVEPLGFSNAKKPDELADEGRQLWKDLHERSGNRTAARVAAKFLVSSYLSGIPMHRTADTRAKRALYHGIDPAENYPREPYPRGQQVPSRELSDFDNEEILTSARRWLGEPISTYGVKGLLPDQRLRQALDLALSTGRYRIDIQRYDELLAQLRGASGPRQGAPIQKWALDRDKLERAIYAKFPPDSKRKTGGEPTVMLTGTTASKLKKADFSTVALADLSMPELQLLAKTMRIVTSSFGGAQSDGIQTMTRHLGRDFKTFDNGVRHMLRLSSEQKTSANQILASCDQLAQSIQNNYEKWGMSLEAAKAVVNRLDRTADAAETFLFGAASLRTRQAEIALDSEDFVKEALDEGLLTRSQLTKVGQVIQRDTDEPYMDTFKNPMSPLETDSDEPYMSAFSDDQSSAVFEGEDDTGRELAP